jgi:polyhydroxyalkanoate synthase
MTDRPDAPGPMRRRGPRPLTLVLTLATSRSSSFAPASPNSSAPPPTPDAALVRGIAAYRRHPYKRDLPDPPVIWQEGGSRLLDYGGDGPTVLVVPSLINRAYVLDLAPERSMLRAWAAGGVRPVLLDWGWPGAEERRYTLTDYVAGRLERALDALPDGAVLAGYCMGGLLALAAALRRTSRLRGLMLLATPWDFHAPAPLALPHGLFAGLLASGALPVDPLQGLFTTQDADGIMAKYRAFATLDQSSERARMFVAIEDWLADGIPLAAPVAEECLDGWYGDNTPAKGEWRIAGQVVDPAALRLPTLVALPAKDRIVPPESAGALAGLIPHATVLRPAAGHVGMVAGARARSALWQPALDWLRAL